LPLPGWIPPAFRRGVTEKKKDRVAAQVATSAADLERAGYVPGVPQGGLNEYQSAIGASTGTDRQTLMQELNDAYLTCPWSWTCVQVIARTITAGGLISDWDADSGEGEEEPDKPAEVIALERFYGFCNPTQDIRQVLRNAIADLLVFGDALLEVTWSGPTPVALWNLDVVTTTPVADEHGKITGYVQVTEFGQRATFETREVIHISLDSARPGVYGVSPTQAMMQPITSWLFAAATEKEMLRKGLPPTIHADLPPSAERTRWRDKVMAQNLGARNIGNPWITVGGGKLTELQAGKLSDVLEAKDKERDTIVAGYGVPPAEANIIESGNLGGGTGDSQHRSFMINTCDPIGAILLEKLNFHIAVEGFGVKGWKSKFGEVDYRDSKTVEEIRDTRLRNGSWTLNKYRASIGEPPVPGGDDAVLVDRQNLVLWSDMSDMSKAMIASKGAPAVAAGEQPPGDEPMQDDDDDDLPQQKPGAPAPPALPAGKGKQLAGKKGSRESVRVVQLANYRRRLNERLHGSPLLEVVSVTQLVYRRLAGCFPASKLGWVKDADTVEWHGPAEVDADEIDTDHLEDWAADHDGPDIARLRKKAKKRAAEGLHLKPVVLVRPAGSAKYVIVDGHHHALAAMKEELPVWAYTGVAKAKAGDWDNLHDYQDRTAA
jgi:hypothetical protein